MFESNLCYLGLNFTMQFWNDFQDDDEYFINMSPPTGSFRSQLVTKGNEKFLITGLALGRPYRFGIFAKLPDGKRTDVRSVVYQTRMLSKNHSKSTFYNFVNLFSSVKSAMLRVLIRPRPERLYCRGRLSTQLRLQLHDVRPARKRKKNAHSRLQEAGCLRGKIPRWSQKFTASFSDAAEVAQMQQKTQPFLRSGRLLQRRLVQRGQPPELKTKKQQKSKITVKRSNICKARILL